MTAETEKAKKKKKVMQMNRQRRSTEEEVLEFLLGEWKNSGHMSPGPFGPGGPATGETSYHWAVGDKWLLYISRLELSGLGRYEVRGGVAFNRQSHKYDAYAINSLGNLLVYEGQWTDENTLTFVLVHPPPRNRARVLYHRLPDGSFKMTSENASEEGAFVPYFEIIYLRA
jgi:hypothetical protein